MKRNKETMYDRVWRAFTNRTPDVIRRDPQETTKELLKRRKGDEAKLARELGVSKRRVRLWSEGKAKPTKANLRKMREAVARDLVTSRSRAASHSVQAQDSPTTVETRKGGLTIRALVKIGTEPARLRTLNLGKEIGASHMRNLGDALVSGNPEAVREVLRQMIAVYVGQSEGYPIEIARLDSISMTALRKAS
jgi:DNA-binding transcriptional regulator YiaG